MNTTLHFIHTILTSNCLMDHLHITLWWSTLKYIERVEYITNSTSNRDFFSYISLSQLFYINIIVTLLMSYIHFNLLEFLTLFCCSIFAKSYTKMIVTHVYKILKGIQKIFCYKVIKELEFFLPNILNIPRQNLGIRGDKI